MEKFIKGIDRHHTNCIKWDTNKDTDVLSFTIADSDYITCQEIIDRIKKRASEGTFGYTFLDDEYFQAIIDWFKKCHGYDLSKDYIITCPGVVTALYLIINQLTNVFDNITISTPVYNPFYSVITNNNRTILTNPFIEKECDGKISYEIDFIDLEEKLSRSKMYIMCNPHNPIGRCFTKEEIEKILRLCEKFNVILVSDEIHCDIIMSDSKYHSLGHYFDSYDKLLVCTAPSKTFNIAGLQDANIFVKNEEYREKIKKIESDMSILRPNILALEACKAAYECGYDWVQRQNEYLTENRDIVYNFAKENLPLCKVCKLEGTYLMWIDMSSLKLSQEDLLNGLLEHGVSVNSGTNYSSSYEGYIRLNIACARDILLEGLSRIKKFVEEVNRK